MHLMEIRSALYMIFVRKNLIYYGSLSTIFHSILRHHSTLLMSYLIVKHNITFRVCVCVCV